MAEQGKTGETGAARALRLAPWALAAAGLLLRLGYVIWTRDAAPHPDLGSFLPSALPFAHPFDTSPREPLFVWWLWLLGKLGAGSVFGIRLAGALWFAPALLLLYRLAEGLAGRRAALAAAAAYCFLPAQVQADALGLRHVLETPLLLSALLASYRAAGAPARAWVPPAAALGALALLRVNYAGFAVLLTALAALRLRSPRPLLAALPALLLLLPHLAANRARHGDAFYSVNLHTAYIANMENLGRPGFPATVEEWQKDPYKSRLTTRQWLFENHSAAELPLHFLEGLGNCLWTFYEKVYFALALPAAAKRALLALYALGLALAPFSPGPRLALTWLLLLCLPYAFPAHVFWAGRFFTPFAPLALLLAAAGAERAAAFRPRRPRS